ncbi:hypothetical protein [Bacillus sp. REN3]|uniref:hypothetical protein n=1 Tax=Bacillus sp. REN3 TaxID=2802440 RepID=UPI001AEECE86|nr:hypothetical protein [Bacillus sp. REN3]
MGTYMSMLLILGAGVVVISLFYTWSIAKEQKKRTSNLDSSIPAEVKEHAYIRNPVFLTYIIVISIALLFIVYFAVTTARY